MVQFSFGSKRSARPDARSMLVVGFGGGVALQGVPESVEDIDVVELEPEVIEANRFIADQRSGDPLADPRVHVMTNDAPTRRCVSR